MPRTMRPNLATRKDGAHAGHTDVQHLGGFTLHMLGPAAHDWLRGQINLAKYFKAHPAACEEYAAVKEKASGPGVSTHDYSAAKEAVILRLKKESAAWAAEKGLTAIDIGTVFPFGGAIAAQAQNAVHDAREHEE